MAELLLELLSEEIPARMQGRAAEDLRRLVTEGLKAQGLAAGESRASPRRAGWRWSSRACPPSRRTSPRRARARASRPAAGDRRVRQVGGAQVDQGGAVVKDEKKGDFYVVRSTSPAARQTRSSPRWCRPSRAGSRGRNRCGGARAGSRGCGHCIPSCACSTARWCRSPSRM